MTATPSETVLVATKLHAPALRPGLVPRGELVARLVAERDRKLTLVCAPAGWGKSTLLGEWCASPEEARPFAWLSLDRGDHDPVRFWRYVIGALRSVRRDLGAAPLVALRSAGPDLVEVVVAPLLNELAAIAEPLVLVLDDYHLVRSEPIHASIAFLLRRLPATLHLAIASRADPPFPLGALRVAGQVTEIRAADLSFNETEAEELLNGSLGLGLDPADIDLLRARTEGWPAGLQLAALSARTVENRRAFVGGFAGRDRMIGDYLRELLEDLSPSLREFLLRTSILDSMCAPLCDAVTGRPDGAERLEEVERSNLFLVALDSRGEWYRYHHLFGDLLRHELGRVAPALVPELHRGASEWHREHGTADEAIAHATAAGDHGVAAELIARHWRPLWAIGDAETVAAWIDALPREGVLGDARLCLARAWTALTQGALDEVEPWALAAVDSVLPGPLYDGTGTVEASTALLRSAHASFAGDVGRAIEYARRALAFYQDDASPWRVVSHVSLAFPLYFAGELAASGEVLAALSPRPGPDLAEPLVYILALLAVMSLDGGDDAKADGHLVEAEQLVSELRLDEHPSVTLVRVGRGRLLEQQGELAAAAVSLRRAVELARRGGRRLELAYALLLLARLEHRRREHVAARAAVREARQVLAACADPGVLRETLAKTERTLQLTPPRRSAAGLPVDPELSERELAVLRLLASELSQREIGSELFISLNTVKAHTRSIFRKLGVSQRAEAVARARDLGLI